MRRKNRQKTAPGRAFFTKKSIFNRFWGPGRLPKSTQNGYQKKVKKKAQEPQWDRGETHRTPGLKIHPSVKTSD